MEDPDHSRRFGGLARLYGEPALLTLHHARVAVVGVGGVGSWAAEALGRSGVGQLTLFDLDHIAPSNTNRQVHTLVEAYGRAKVEAMRDRLLAINPRCTVDAVDDFVTPENVVELISADLDAVIDCADGVRAKVALIAHCKGLRVPVVTCGAAGGKTDPTALRVDDLARTTQDPLLAKVRQRLRKDYGFPRDRKFDVSAVYSSQPMRWPDAACDPVGGLSEPTGGTNEVPMPQSNAGTGRRNEAPQGLSCAGYGSIVTVTASMGFFAAARIITLLTGDA